MGELLVGLTKYLTFYNGERPHQSLSDGMPGRVYESGQGGGAKIVNKYCTETNTEIGTFEGQRLPAPYNVVGET